MIVPAILRHLCHHINNRDDNLDKSLDALGSILLMLHKQDSVSLSFFLSLFYLEPHNW
jgi:hypothetical protein